MHNVNQTNQLHKVASRRATAPVDDPAVDDLENDDPLSTVFEEVRHLLLQLGLHLMLGDHLQMIP